MPEYAGGRFPGFFWRVADGDYNECTFNGTYPDITSDGLWHPDCSNGYDLGVNRGASWYVGGEDKYVDPKMTIEKPANRAEWTSGNRWLTMVGVKPEGDARFRRLLVDALDGRLPGRQDHRFLQDVRQERREPPRRPRPWSTCSSPTPRAGRRTRAYLVGRGADGTLHHPELTRGTFPWTEVKEVVTAPESAVRMALALGILPCKGEVGFDDINVKTADGPTPAGESEIVEARPTVIPKERMREIIYLDLSKVANRSLADDVAGDGRGGWTDEGPDKDMRRLPTGDQVIGGIPFRIARGPKAVVAVAGQSPARQRRGQGSDDPRRAEDGSALRPPRRRLPGRRTQDVL